jgi:UPF0758 N-terminal
MGVDRPHYLEHRQRLRKRFLTHGLEGFADYEVVELLLTLAIPRADVKPQAKALMAHFGNLRGLLDASLEDLQAVPGIGPVTAIVLRIIREAASLYLQQTAEQHDSFADPDVLARFWRTKIGAQLNEIFQVPWCHGTQQSGVPGADAGLHLCHLGHRCTRRSDTLCRPGGVPETERRHCRLQSDSTSPPQRAAGAQWTVPRRLRNKGYSGFLPAGPHLFRQRRGAAYGRLPGSHLWLLWGGTRRHTRRCACRPGSLRGRWHYRTGQTLRWCSSPSSASTTLRRCVRR